MSGRQNHSTGSESIPEILRTLAADLPDELLSRYLPKLRPDEARAGLEEAARALSGLRIPERPEAGALSKTRPVSAGKPSLEKLTLYTDGAARGNPGEAGAGVQILDSTGEEIFVRGTYLGQCTNNVAEYQALRLGLIEARKIGGRAITIFLDSELIVRQML